MLWWRRNTLEKSHKTSVWIQSTSLMTWLTMISLFSARNWMISRPSLAWCPWEESLPQTYRGFNRGTKRHSFSRLWRKSSSTKLLHPSSLHWQDSIMQRRTQVRRRSSKRLNNPTLRRSDVHAKFPFPPTRQLKMTIRALGWLTVCPQNSKNCSN